MNVSFANLLQRVLLIGEVGRGRLAKADTDIIYLRYINFLKVLLSYVLYKQRRTSIGHSNEPTQRQQ